MIGGIERWNEKARAAVAGRAFFVVGIGVAQMLDFQRLGGSIVGALSVLPSGGPPFAPSLDFPVLSLTGSTRHIFDLVVNDFATTISRNAPRVREVLEACDPDRRATVVSYLPVPSGPFGRREIWAQEAAVGQRLEHKRSLREILLGLLPAVPAIECTWPIDPGAWESAQAELDAEVLVAQHVGLSGGGMGTFVCPSHALALHRLATLDGRPVRLMPWIDGTACNVMGHILDQRRVITFPPSRQLVQPDAAGRPLYAGNVFGEAFSSAEIGAIQDELRALGRALAARGHRGPFGVDFLRTARGARLYHDVNPRMNGSVDSLAHYLWDGIGSPLRTLLLARCPWSPEEMEALEQVTAAAVAAAPTWRFFMAKAVERPTRLDTIPRAGLWEVEPNAPAVRFVAAGGGPEGIVGQRALLEPTAPPGLGLLPRDSLVLGDLFCSAELGHALEARHGAGAGQALLDAFLGVR
ncbi:MAG: hypothetical protein ABIO70_31710 [Pseudomonadota bacterium]